MAAPLPSPRGPYSYSGTPLQLPTSASSPLPPKPEFQCREIDTATGKLCGKIFNRRNNLKRHVRDIHQSRRLKFIHYNANGMSTRDTHGTNPGSSSTEEIVQPLDRVTWDLQGFWSSSVPNAPTFPPHPTSITPLPASSVSNLSEPVHESRHSTSSTSGPATRNITESYDIPTYATALNSSLGASPPAPSLTPVEVMTQGPAHPMSHTATQSITNTDAMRVMISPRLTINGTGEGVRQRQSNSSGRKRRRSVSSDHLIARFYDPIPAYPVKLSKTKGRQQEGIDWLQESAKTKFDETYSALLARWGVKPAHKGTCVLLSRDTKTLEPMELIQFLEEGKFNLQESNMNGSGRLNYQYSDHRTNFGRALAWFSEWPRRAIDLCNFIGCGPYSPMEASHLCHHDYCIVHVIYEEACINQDRNACRKAARVLRQNREEVPEHCTRHFPPCLMQVS